MRRRIDKLGLRPQALLVIVILVIVATVALACERGWHDVRVDNQSQRVVVVTENGKPASSLHPGEQGTFHIPPFSGSATYEVIDFETREVVASRTFTFEEIKREDGIDIKVE